MPETIDKPTQVEKLSPRQPTETVCIETIKVYDYCFQTDSIENACFAIPAACSCPVSANVTISCRVLSTTSRVLNRTQLPPPAPAGFARVTLEVTTNLEFTLKNADNTVRCTFTTLFPFIKTIALCAPKGTDVEMEVAAARCGPSFLLGGNQICTEIDLCILIQSVAAVKLLVPSYGFCTPAECIELPKTPLPCPPSPLYPPTCSVPSL